MVDVLELAKYLLYLNKEEADPDGDEAASDMTAMKLQKLLYYCQGYSLGMTGKPLFLESIVAWAYGPVVKSVYKEYKTYKGQCIPLDIANAEPCLDDYTRGIARLVMRNMGKYSAPMLMKMTHREPAWREAIAKTDPLDPYPSEPLSSETMQGYFSNILIEELPDEEEERLWASSGREPTEEEWAEIALSI